MAKQTKFLDVNTGMTHLEAIKKWDMSEKPYIVRLVWFDSQSPGFRRTTIAKFSTFMFVLAFVRDFFEYRLFELSAEEIKNRVKEM